MDSEDEELIRLFTDATNREVLTALTDASHGLSVTEISEQLVSEDKGNIEQMVISLHHNYLPRLDEVGLIKYDRDENIVTSENCLASDVKWMDIDVLNDQISRSKRVAEQTKAPLDDWKGAKPCTTTAGDWLIEPRINCF